MARNRRRRPKRSMRLPVTVKTLRRSATAVAFAATGVAGIWALASVLDRPIRAVTLSGEFERVAPIQVEASLGELQGIGFLSADLESLRARVEALPWVDEARVQRRWPGEIQVIITEQTPAARWKESGLLNTRGQLFLPETRHAYAELPALAGPEGSETTVARRYLDMRGPLVERGQLLTGVRLDDRGAWRLSLGGGMEVRLGRQDVDERFERFLQIVVPILASREDRAAYVDMRYTRGFAIAWDGSRVSAVTDNKGKQKDV